MIVALSQCRGAKLCVIEKAWGWLGTERSNYVLCDVKVSDCQIWSVGNVQWDNNQVKDSQELFVAHVATCKQDKGWSSAVSWRCLGVGETSDALIY